MNPGTIIVLIMLPHIWSVSICYTPVPVLILIFLSLGLNTIARPLFFPLTPTPQELESAKVKASKFARVNVSGSIITIAIWLVVSASKSASFC